MAGFKSNNNIPERDSTSNGNMSDVLGNKTDRAFSNADDDPSVIGHLVANYYHVHSPAKIYPRDAAPITITAGAGAYNEGTKTTILASDAAERPGYRFDIHWIIVGTISAQDDYILKIYIGEAGNEEFWGEAAFSRDSNQQRGSQFPIQGPPIPVNTRISASLMSGSGSDTCDIKIYTHIYSGVN